ncbi:MAG: diguanylate cyclase protein [Herbinix sp.]|jgi:diguanylate cyclase (GGDEF)-like protein|nr:diguanylate cyclase protein [Herbinix sp.]
MKMKFNSITQAITSVGMLQKYYSVIRIRDTASRQILYENENAEALQEAPESISFIGECIREVEFCIQEKDELLEINTTLPIFIDDRACSLELLYLDDMRASAGSLVHIQRLAITDALTNLYNRRFINEQLPIDLERSFSNNDPVSFIYTDIDYFKMINDQYGHITGDNILKEVADVFLKNVRRKDGWVARYGGDEFLICLPEISHNLAGKMANRLCRSVENRCHNMNGENIRITCSFGVGTVHKESGIHSIDQVIDLMDKKLYQAKNNGRNQVVT